MTELYGSPYLTYRINTSFALTIRAYNSIGGIELIGVQLPVTIGTAYCLIRESPHKTTGKERMRGVVRPEIFQSGTMSLIILPMHELGGHKHIIAVCKTPHTGEIGRIMMRIQSVKVCPRMNHVTLLGIIAGKILVECRIPPSFIAIAPKHNRRMIDVPDYHLFQKPPSHC